MTKLSSEVLNAMVDDSYEAWKSILQSRPNITQVLIYLELCHNLKKRLREIRLGLKHNLTLEQINMYARPEFDFSQMEPIRLGLEAGFTLDQIKRYASSEFSGQKMMEIYLGYWFGLTEEQIGEYANPNFDEDKMSDVRWGYIAKLTPEQIQVHNTIQAKRTLMKQDKADILKSVIDSNN